MGISDFFSDLYSSVITQDVVAEAPKADTGDEHQSGKDHGGLGTAEQRGSSVRGGASNTTPASAGVAKESPQEAEVNRADVKKGAESSDDKASAQDEDQPEEEPAEEEEEEEEEEPEDIKDKLEEECAESKACAPAKHHYDHCVERVTKQIDDNGKADEDCVEEFFHLAHCATACAAPKLFAALK